MKKLTTALVVVFAVLLTGCAGLSTGQNALLGGATAIALTQHSPLGVKLVAAAIGATVASNVGAQAQAHAQAANPCWQNPGYVYVVQNGKPTCVPSSAGGQYGSYGSGEHPAITRARAIGQQRAAQKGLREAAEAAYVEACTIGGGCDDNRTSRGRYFGSNGIYGNNRGAVWR